MKLAMRELLDRLKALQALDLEIRTLRNETGRWPEILQLRDREVEAREETLRRKDEARKTLRREIDKRELKLKSFEEEIVKFNVTLNSVKTNKEYAAILNEIAGKKAQISEIEEEILERLEAVEAALREVNAAKEVVETARHEREKLGRQADQERAEIEAEMNELLGRRNGALAGLPSDLLDQYEKIAQGRDGVAVVAVSEGVCQGCYINLTAQEINLLMGADNIIRCKNCSRILFLEP